MTARSPLSLHLADADDMTAEEIAAVLELKPSTLLTLCYAQWDRDKGVADAVVGLVDSLRHADLYVRFHADPHPPGYAARIGGPEAWGRLCARRMAQYYELLAQAGVRLHAILANELDADYEGGLNSRQASDFLGRAMHAYAMERPGDILHVPATTGAPETHRAYLQQYLHDGWLDNRPEYWIDGHGYDGDLENVLNVLRAYAPGRRYAITETNDLADFDWPIELLRQGRADAIFYFILNWAHGGEGRVRPPNADDAAKRMSLLRFPDRYAQFKATVAEVAAPVEPPPPPVEEPPVPEPEEPWQPRVDPWAWWPAERIAAAARCPLDAVRTHWPILADALATVGLWEREIAVSVIGTVAHETASTFAPIHEYGTPADWARYSGGAAYAGRGFIQLTHDYNYREVGRKLSELWGGTIAPDALVQNPDLALDPWVSAACLALYWRDRRATPSASYPAGYSLVEASRARDFDWVRILVLGATAGVERLREVDAALSDVRATHPAYNADARVDVQDNDYECSVESLQWLLRSLGRDPADGWLDAQLVPGVVSPDVGLRDARGIALAEFFDREYGSDGVTAGLHAEWKSPVSFDEVLARAGMQPIIVGGRRYGPGGHWVGVRRADENGWLELANPAPNYTGTGTHLDRGEWEARGPWSMVTVPLAPIEEGEDLVRVKELEDRVAQLTVERDEAIRARDRLVEGLAVAADDHGDAIQRALDEIRRIRAERVGPRPAA